MVTPSAVVDLFKMNGSGLLYQEIDTGLELTKFCCALLALSACDKPPKWARYPCKQ
jgi:hypothetical protein